MLCISLIMHVHFTPRLMLQGDYIQCAQGWYTSHHFNVQGICGKFIVIKACKAEHIRG